MVNDIESFTSYLRYEKRYSPHTVTGYCNDLVQFFDYLDVQYQIKNASEATHFLIRSWIVSLMENGLDARTVGRKITTLRTFYRFLLKTGKTGVNPMLKVTAPKTAKKLPEYIDEPRMERMLSEETDPSDYKSVRDHLIVDFFYRTGIRRSELINLRLQDIDLYSLTVMVTGKRNKVRYIPLTMSFGKTLETYIKTRAEFLLDNNVKNEYLFTDNSGNKMYPNFVYRSVKAVISRFSTGRKKSPHILRHSFATTMLNNGADINSIKELLGHSSLAATQVYTHNSTEKLREIYKQAFPKA